MIRATKHDLLWFDGRRRRTKHVGDVFRADPAVEAQWVAEGVAEYVEDAPVESPEPEPAPERAAGETYAADAEPEGERDLADMTRAELAELAEGYGISVGRKTKAQLVAAIEEAEQAPSLSAAEVEQA